MLKIQKYIKNAKIPLISALKKQLHDVNRNEHQSDAQTFILCRLFKYMNKHKQTQRIMYLTDLTDAQKEYIKGTILMDNWHSKYDFFSYLTR